MQATKKWTQDLVDYHWQHYSELAHQRNQNIEAIKQAIASSCISDFKFEKWQRAVKYQFRLQPLCTVGRPHFSGGRFNYGSEVNANITSFQCLYFAEDKATAYQETLGKTEPSESKLSALELALTNPLILF